VLNMWHGWARCKLCCKPSTAHTLSRFVVSRSRACCCAGVAWWCQACPSHMSPHRVFHTGVFSLASCTLVTMFPIDSREPPQALAEVVQSRVPPLLNRCTAARLLLVDAERSRLWSFTVDDDGPVLTQQLATTAASQAAKKRIQRAIAGKVGGVSSSVHHSKLRQQQQPPPHRQKQKRKKKQQQQRSAATTTTGSSSKPTTRRPTATGVPQRHTSSSQEETDRGSATSESGGVAIREFAARGVTAGALGGDVICVNGRRQLESLGSAWVHDVDWCVSLFHSTPVCGVRYLCLLARSLGCMLVFCAARLWVSHTQLDSLTCLRCLVVV